MPPPPMIQPGPTIIKIDSGRNDGPTANSVEPTLKKSLERKSDVLPSSGDSVSSGSAASSAVFYAV